MKKIKFNLICDSKSVANLESLKENFNICDIVDHFKTKKLHKWLESRGHTKELEAINKIGLGDHVEYKFIQDLSNIFEHKLSVDEAKEFAVIINYQTEKEKRLLQLKENQKQRSDTLQEYHKNFEKHIDIIVQHSKESSIIKKHLEIIQEDFWDLFLLSREMLFYFFYIKAPLALLIGLGLEKIRPFFLEHPRAALYIDFFRKKIKEEELEKLENIYSICNNKITAINTDLLSPLTHANFSCFKVYQGDTDAYWKDLEEKGKKILVLEISQGAYARSIGKNGEEVGSSEINRNFLIFDGLDFKSNNSEYSIKYLEI